MSRTDNLTILNVPIHGHRISFHLFGSYLFRPSVQFSSFQSLSHVQLFATPWITARQASLSITNSWSSLRLTSIKSMMPSSHLILCRPLLLLPSIPRSIRVFSNESTLRMRWPKYWSFRFSIIPSKERPGLISFRMDWLDLLAVQGTLKSLHTTVQKHLFRPYLVFIILCIFPRWKLRRLSWYCSLSLTCAFSAINFPLSLLWLHPIDFVMLSSHFGASLVAQW